MFPKMTKHVERGACLLSSLIRKNGMEFLNVTRENLARSFLDFLVTNNHNQVTMFWYASGLLGLFLLCPINCFSPHHGMHHAQRAPSLSRKVAHQTPRLVEDRSRMSRKNSVFGSIELSDLLYDDTSTALEAWQWTANICAPAALVAGAVLASMNETRERSVPRQLDPNWVRMLKRIMRFLLLTSFALEVVSIFVGTMTGSVLLGHGKQVASKAIGYKSPLQLLHHHHE